MLPFAIGDIVWLSQQACMITGIQKELGHSQYHVVDLSKCSEIEVIKFAENTDSDNTVKSTSWAPQWSYSTARKYSKHYLQTLGNDPRDTLA